LSEWIEWTPDLARERDDVRSAVERFAAPSNPAGDEAARWLREESLRAYRESPTRLLYAEGEVQGYHSLAMGEVELRQDDRRRIDVDHPRQGAVLITWLARSRNPALAGVAELLLLHATGVARRVATEVGATVIALDPYDEETAIMWRDRYGFRPSNTQRGNRPRRMWNVLFPR
jgi:hypothetical protein